MSRDYAKYNPEMHKLFEELDAQKKGFDLSANPLKNVLDAIKDMEWKITDHYGEDLYGCIDVTGKTYLVKANHMRQDAWAVPMPKPEGTNK